MDIYVQKNGQQLGPFPEMGIRQRIEAGEFSPDDLASCGENERIPLGELLDQSADHNPVSAAGVAPDRPPIGNVGPKLLLYALASAVLSGGALVCAFHDYKVLWFLGTLGGIVIGHYVRRFAPPQPSKRLTRRLARIGLFIGYGTTSIYLAFLLLMFVVIHWPRSYSPQVAALPQKRVELRIADQMQPELEANKQNIFNNLHPLGTAKSIVLHDVTVRNWKDGKDTDRFEDIQQFSIRYTLYWSTPLTADGFTKIEQVYDAESQRYTSTQILATNGMTNQDAQSALGKVVGTLLQYQAQKAGAEEAAHQYYNNQ